MNESFRASRRPLLVAAAATAVLLASVWIANQGGLSPDVPPGVFATPNVNGGQVVLGKFISVIYLWLSSAGVLAATWLSAAGWGWPWRYWICQAPDNSLSQTDPGGPASSQAPLACIQIGAGLTTLLLIHWLCATAGLLTAAAAWAITLCGCGMLLAQITLACRRAPMTPRITLPWAIVLAAPAIGVMVVACCIAPSLLWKVEAYGYDVTSYHLQLPREWLELGVMRGLAHNAYSFLPSLGEAGFMAMGAMRGSMYAGIYTSQMFHATAAIFTAIAAGALVARRFGGAAGALAAALMLATPWTVVTGTLAYNEWFAMAMGTTALLLVLDPTERTMRRACLAGVLVGGATMVKLTAGPMLAVPIGVMLLWRSSAIKLAIIAALAGLLTVSPYLARNAVQTGNPIFPIATGSLGHGHWTADQAQRWSQAHAATGTAGERLAALGRQWLCNRGYGAVGGSIRTRAPGAIESQNIARFDREWGIPVLWLLVLGSAALLMTRREHRTPATMLLTMLAIQIVVWLTLTHLQARFLIWSLLPCCVLAAMGVGALGRSLSQRVSVAAYLPGALVVVCMTFVTFTEFFGQTVPTVIGGRGRPTPVWQLVDALPPAEMLSRLAPNSVLVGDHPVNHLPPGSRTLFIADASRMLYVRGPHVYSSAFDSNELGDIVRAVGDDPQTMLRELQRRGFTHLWVHWSELRRLIATYGYDPDVTIERITALRAAGLRVEMEFPSASKPSVTLLALPPAER